MTGIDAAAPVGGISVIGLGSMGTGMAGRLLDRGFGVTVWNRTAAKCDELAARGAVPARSPAAAAGQAGTVLLSLADQDVVERVVFGTGGVIESLRPDGVIVDTSTVSPGFARDLARRAGRTGHHALDARVLGNAGHARAGELRVMVGGERRVFERAAPVLAALGKQVTYLGDSGSAAAMKLVLNMLMGVQLQALAEAVVLGEQAGLPRQAVLDMIAASGFSSPVMRFKCGVMGRRAFAPADFKLSLMRKDMALIRSEAQRLQVPLAVADAAYTMLTAAVRHGLGELDCAAVLAFMEHLSGLPAEPTGPAVRRTPPRPGGARADA